MWRIPYNLRCTLAAQMRFLVASSAMEVDFHWFERVTFADGEACDYRRVGTMTGLMFKLFLLKIEFVFKRPSI